MIVKLMEDRRDGLAVIAAGYTAEMRDSSTRTRGWPRGSSRRPSSP
jgi:hypothetical protein